jgi:hypothetical protein
MTEKLTYAGELTVQACWCGMRHAVPTELVEHMRYQHDDGREQTAIHCPLGHAWILRGESKAKRLDRELAETKAQLLATRDQLAAAERETKRQAKRASAGVCPCCQRSFVQLARHMKNQHPDYESEDG